MRNDRYKKSKIVTSPKPVAKVAASTASVPYGPRLLNRELSLLAFNQRVLAQAQDDAIPLLERLKYLCIVSSNLDEFFEVRIASLMARHREERGTDHHMKLLDFDDVSSTAHALVREQYATLNDMILPALAESGIHLLRHHDRNEAQRQWVKEFFEREVRPLLTPIVLDPAHPFPQVVNKSLNFIVELDGKDAFGRGTTIAVITTQSRAVPEVESRCRARARSWPWLCPWVGRSGEF